MKFKFKRLLALLMAVMLAIPSFAFAEDVELVLDVDTGSDTVAEDLDLDLDVVVPGELTQEEPTLELGSELQNGDLLEGEVALEAPAQPFEQTLEYDGLRFTVKADAGVVGEGAVLSVTGLNYADEVAEAAKAIGVDGVHKAYGIYLTGAAFEAGKPVVRVEGAADVVSVVSYGFDKVANAVEAKVDGAAVEFALDNVQAYDIVSAVPAEEAPVEEEASTIEEAAPVEAAPAAEEEEVVIEEAPAGEAAPADDGIVLEETSEEQEEVVIEEAPAEEAAAEDDGIVLDEGEEAPAEEIEIGDAPAEEAAAEETPVEENTEDEFAIGNYPAFSDSVTVNGVKVYVNAPEGAFPEGATLSVEAVTVEAEQAQVDQAVEAVRDESVNVARSYTFDIKVLDAEGNELQPANGQSVEVTFRTGEVANKNLTTEVYHVTDEGEAQALEVSESSNKATVETEGFSIYQVEFTYENKYYVLPGDQSVALSEILTAVGLNGTPTAVEVSNSTLFNAEQVDGQWIVTAKQPFHTDEWMKVTISGIVYEIKVTDEETSINSFSALQTAIANAPVSASLDIKLDGDIEIDGTNKEIVIDNGKTITIDMNNHKISSAEYGMLFKIKQAKLILKGTGTVDTSGVNTSAGYYTIQIQGAASSFSGHPYGLTVGEDVTIKSNGYAAQVTFNNDAAYGVQMDLNGKIVAKYGVTVNGTNTKTTGNIPVVNLGGSITGGGELYAAGYAEYNVNANITDADECAIELRAGKMNITGGTYSVKNGVTYSATPNGSGTSIEGAGIAVSQHNTELDINLTIKNGVTVSGSSAFAVANPQGNDNGKINIDIQGGTFNGSIESSESRVTKFISGGLFNPEPNEDYLDDDVESAKIDGGNGYVVGKVGNTDAGEVEGKSENSASCEVTKSIVGSDGTTATKSVAVSFAVDSAADANVIAPIKPTYLTDNAIQKISEEAAGTAEGDAAIVTLSVKVEKKGTNSYDVQPVWKTGTAQESKDIDNGMFEAGVSIPVTIKTGFGSGKMVKVEHEHSNGSVDTILTKADSDGNVTVNVSSFSIFTATLQDDATGKILDYTKSQRTTPETVYYSTINAALTADPDHVFRLEVAADSFENTDTYTLTKGQVVKFRLGTNGSILPHLLASEGYHVAEKPDETDADVINYSVEPNTYKVTFNSNGDGVTGTMAEQDFVYDQKQNLTANAFKRNGFIFAGWDESAAATAATAVYEDEEEVVNLTAENNGTVELFAIWDEITTIRLSNESYIYDGNAKEPQVEYVGTASGKILTPGADYTVSYANNVNAGATTDTNAPTVTVTFKDGSTMGVKFTIEKKTLTITAEDKWVVSGAALPTFTSKWNGLVGADTLTQDDITYSAPTAPVTVDTNIVAALKEAARNRLSANYNVSFKDGKLHVIDEADVPAIARIAGDDTFTYNGSAQVPSIVVEASGNTLSEGDNGFRVTYKTADDAATEVTNPTEAGTYIATVALTGTAATSYILIGQKSFTFTIEPKEVIVTPVAAKATKVYGEEDPTPYYEIEAVQGVDFTGGSLARESGENVGEYAFNLGTLTAGPNYTLKLAEDAAKFTITPKPLTITAGDVVIAYGGTPVYTSTIEGKEDGDTIEVTYTVTDAAGAKWNGDAGTYTITPDADDANYDISVVTGELKVNPKAVTVTAGDVTIAYGETPEYTSTIETLESGDEVEVTYTVTDAADAEWNGDAGTYTITPSITDTNYACTPVTGTLTVNKVDLTITADDKTVEYEQAALALTATFDGLTNGDTKDNIEYTLVCENASGMVDTYPITITAPDVSDEGKKNKNYNVQRVSGTYTITKKELAVVINPAEKSYGEADPEFTADVTYKGEAYTFPTGHDSAVELKLDRENKSENVGTYPISAKLEGEGAGNYDLKVTGANLVIKPAKLTVTAAKSGETLEKVYDGNTDATSLKDKIALTVKNGTDEVTGITVAIADAVFASKNVGNPNTITLTYGDITGTDAENYELAATTGTVDGAITPKALSLKVIVQDKPYDGNMDATVQSAILSGVVPGDDVYVDDTVLKAHYKANTATTNKLVWAEQATIAASIKGSDVGNYTKPATATYNAPTIYRAPLTIQAPSRKIKVGDDLPDLGELKGEVVISGLKGDDVVGNIAYDLSYSVENSIVPGVYKIVVDPATTATGNRNNNYDILPINGTLTIDDNDSAYTVEFAENVPESYTYDGTAKEPEVVVTYMKGKGESTEHVLEKGKDYTLAYKDNTDAGTAKVTVLPKEGSDYASFKEHVLEFTIDKAVLSVTPVVPAAGATKVYDGDDDAMGLVGEGEDKIHLTITPLVATDIVDVRIKDAQFDSKGVDATKITVTFDEITGEAAKNYKLAAETAQIPGTITQKEVTVTVTVKNKVYDGKTDAEMESIVINDYIDGDDLTVEPFTVAFGNANVGLGKTIVFTPTPLVLAGEDAPNYKWDEDSQFSEVPTANITPATAIVTVTRSEFIYDGKRHDVEYTVKDADGVELDKGANAVLAYDVADQSDHVHPFTGEVPFTISPKEGSNYTFVVESGNFTISPRPVKIIADNAEKVYGEADPTTFTFTTEFAGDPTKVDDPEVGIIDADLAALNITVTRPDAADHKAVGVYKGDLVVNVTKSANEAAYYVITEDRIINGDFEIKQRDITLAVDAATKSFGDSDPEYTFQPTAGTSYAEGDTAESFNGKLTRYGVGTVDGERPGTHTGVVGHDGELTNPNYKITLVPGDLTINAKELTVVPDDQEKTYGEDDPEFTYKVYSKYVAPNSDENEEYFLNSHNVLLTLTRKAAGTDEAQGEYPISKDTFNVTAIGSDADGYTFTIAAGHKLTINKRSLRIKIDDISVIKGTKAVDFTYTILGEGLVNNDAFAEGDVVLNTDPAYTKNTAVGRYKIKETIADPLTGTGMTNYNVTVDKVAGYLTVVAEDTVFATVSIDATAFTYDGKGKGTITVTEPDKTPAEGTDYKLTYKKADGTVYSQTTVAQAAETNEDGEVTTPAVDFKAADKPVEAGEYTAIVEMLDGAVISGNSSYDFYIEAKPLTVEWSVKQGEAEATTLDNNTKKTYVAGGYTITALVKISDDEHAELKINGAASVTATNAGVYNLVATLPTAQDDAAFGYDNYTLTDDTRIFTIEPVQVNTAITATDLQYTGASQSPEIKVTAGNPATDVDVNVYAIYDNVQTDVGTYTATVVLNDPNYAFAPGARHAFGWNIVPATVTATAANVNFAEYNAETHPFAAVTVASVVKPDEPLSDSQYTVTYYKVEGEGDEAKRTAIVGEPKDAGTYEAKVTILDSNYTPATVDVMNADGEKATVTIGQKPLTIKWTKLIKHYNGEEQDPDYEVQGVIPGEDPQITLTSDPPERINAYANYTITARAANPNYIVNNNIDSQDQGLTTITFTIDQAEISIEWGTDTSNPSSRAYDGTSFDYKPVSVKAGDIVLTEKVGEAEGDYTVTYNKDDRVDVGEYRAKVELVDKYKTNTNYQMPMEPDYIHDFHITPAVVGIEWDDPEDGYVYTGEAIVPSVKVTLNDKDLTEGEDYTVAYFKGEDTDPMTDDPVDVGGYRAAVVLSDNFTRPEDYADYPYEITPATAWVEWADTSAYKYDGNEHKPLIGVYGLNGEPLSEWKEIGEQEFAGDYSIAYTVPEGSTGSDDTENAGDYTATVTMENPNYTFYEYNEETDEPVATDEVVLEYNVARAMLTIYAKDYTAVYGTVVDDALLHDNVTISKDLIGDDVIGYVVKVEDAINVGDYPITIEPLEDDNNDNTNYIITFVPATLHITPRHLTVTADTIENTIPYGTEPLAENPFNFTVKLTGAKDEGDGQQGDDQQGDDQQGGEAESPYAYADTKATVFAGELGTLLGKHDAKASQVGTFEISNAYGDLAVISPNYVLDKVVAGELTVEAVSSTGVKVELQLPVDPYTYDGTQKKPGVKVYIPATGQEGTEETIDPKQYTVIYGTNVDAGHGSVTVVVNEGYDLVLADGQSLELSFPILPKELELNWYDSEATKEAQAQTYSYEYDGDQHIPYAEINETEKVEGDEVTFDTVVNGGAVDAGRYTATAVNLSNPNYTLTNTTQDFTITKRALVITLHTKKDTEDATKLAYDITFGEQPDLEGMSQDDFSVSQQLVTGHTMTVNMTIAENGKLNDTDVAWPHAGSYAVTATLNDVTIVQENDLKNVRDNYSISFVRGTFTVAQRPILITEVEVPGTFVYTAKAQEPEVKVTFKDADDQEGQTEKTVTVSKEDDDFGIDYTNNIDAYENTKIESKATVSAKATGNYVLAVEQVETDATGTFKIDQREVTLSTADRPYTGVKNLPDPATQINVGNRQTRDGASEAENCTVVTIVETDNDTYVDVGDHTFTVTALSNANYKLPDPATVTYKITPLALTIIPTSGQSKYYGDDDPVIKFTVNTEGLVEADKTRYNAAAEGDATHGGIFESGTGLSYEGAGKTATVGEHNIVLNGLKAKNYDPLTLSDDEVKFTVQKRVIHDDTEGTGADLVAPWNSKKATYYTGSAITAKDALISRVFYTDNKPVELTVGKEAYDVTLTNTTTGTIVSEINDVGVYLIHIEEKPTYSNTYDIDLNLYVEVVAVPLEIQWSHVDDLEYNGQEQSPTAVFVVSEEAQTSTSDKIDPAIDLGKCTYAGELPTITVNGKAVNVSYTKTTATATYTENRNFKVLTEDKTTKFSINPCKLLVTWIGDEKTGFEYTYNSQEQGPTATVVRKVDNVAGLWLENETWAIKDNQKINANAEGEHYTAALTLDPNPNPANYVFVDKDDNDATTQAFTINPMHLTLEADDQNKIYEDKIDTLTYVVSEGKFFGTKLTDIFSGELEVRVVEGETKSYLKAGADVPDVGYYQIGNFNNTLTCIDPNYELDDVEIGWLTVGKKDILTATVVVNKSYVYNGKEQKPVKGVDIVVTRGDDSQVLPAEQYEVRFEDNINAGKAKVFVTSGNYTLNLTDDFATTFDIERKPLNVTWKDKDGEGAADVTGIETVQYVYDGQKHTPVASIETNTDVSTDTDGKVIKADAGRVELVQVPAKDKGYTNRGSYNATATTLKGEAASNYTLNPANHTKAFDITYGTIYIKVAEIEGTKKVYDGTTAANLSMKSDYKLYTDQACKTETADANLKIESIYGAFADKNVGAPKIVNMAVTLSNPNYKWVLSSDDFTGEITPMELTVKADDQRITMGEAVPVLTWNVVKGTVYDDYDDVFAGVLKADGLGEAGTETKVGGRYDIVQNTLKIKEGNNNYKLADANGNALYKKGTLTVEAIYNGVTVELVKPDETFIYNGKEHTPEVKVYYTENDQKKPLDVQEYFVEYQDNIDAGRAKVTVVPKATSYARFNRSIATSFIIKPKPVKLTWFADEAFTETKLDYIYDGEAHQPYAKIDTLGQGVDGTDTDGKLVYGDTCKVLVTGEKTNSGSYVAKAVDLTNHNYELPKYPENQAAFTISKSTLDIELKTVTKVWANNANWTEPKSEEYIKTAASLVPGHKVTVEVTREKAPAEIDGHKLITDHDVVASPYEVTISSVKVVDANGVDVTENYDDSYKTLIGLLEVTPKPTTVVIALGDSEEGYKLITRSEGVGFVYNGQVQKPTVTLTDKDTGDVLDNPFEYTFDATGDLDNNPPVKASASVAYNITITDSDKDKDPKIGNYSIDTIEGNKTYYIFPKLLDDLVWDEDQLTYNGEQQYPKAHEPGFPEVTFQYSMVYGDGVHVYGGKDGSKQHTVKVVGINGGNGNFEMPKDGTACLSKTYTIDPAKLTVTLTKGLTKVYGDADAKLNLNDGYTITGFVNGETAASVGLTGEITRKGGEDVDGSPYAYSVEDLKDKLGDYVFSMAQPYTLTITRRPLEVSWTQVNKGNLEMKADGWKRDENDVLYKLFGNIQQRPDNLVLVDPTITASGVSKTVAASEYDFDWSNPSSFHAGEYTFKVLDTKDGNFDITCPKNLAYRIDPVQVSLNWTDHLVYNGKEQKPTVIATVNDDNFSNVKLIADVQVVTQPSQDVNLPTGTEEANAKPKYRAFVKQLLDNGSTPKMDQNTIDKNFTFDKTEHEFYITPATLTVTADNLTKVYRDPDPELTYKVTGLQGEDTEAEVLTGKLVREAGEDVGVYDILNGYEDENGEWVETLETNKNYDMAFVAGTLTITEKPLTVKNADVQILDVPRTYNGKQHKPEVVVTVDGVVIPSSEYTVTYENNLNAGNAEIYLADVPGGNYNLVFEMKPTLTFEIKARTVTLKWSPLEFQYDGKRHVPTCKVQGLIEGDTCRASVSYSEKPVKAGTYTAFAVDLSNKNYKLPKNNTTKFVIKPIKAKIKKGEVVLSKTSYTYNGKAKTPVVTVYSDGVVIPKSEYKVTYKNNIHAGTATVTIKNVSGNYDLDFETKTYNFTILQRTAELVWSNLNFVYDGKAHKPTATVGNLVKGDTCKVTVRVIEELVSNAKYITAKEIGGYVAQAIKLSNKDYKLPEETTTDFYIAPRKVSGNLILTMKRRTNKDSLKLKWTKVKGVDGYDIYMSRCTDEYNHYLPELVQTIDNNSTFTWYANELKPGTCYKALVKAFILVDGKKEYVRTSLKAHCVTFGPSKYTNSTELKVNKEKLTLKKGKTFQIKATTVKEAPSKKYVPHEAEVRYFSTDTSVATVTSDGMITAVGAGFCRIYVETLNGIYKGIKVTVK